MENNKPLLDWFLIFSFICLIILVIFIANVVLWDSCQALSCGSTKMPTVVANEEEIWTHDHELIRLLEEAELPKVTDIDELYNQICAKVPNSPICWNKELLKRIDTIGQQKWVPTRLLIGVSYAESHIGVNFNREACRGYNNWFWLKWKKHDNGKVEWFTKDRKKDANGCWLYKFQSIEEWFYSLANTISLGYKSCQNNTTCLAYWYVGNPNVAEPSWIKHVSMWY